MYVTSFSLSPVIFNRVKHPPSGRYLECLTTEPGMQLYTSFYLNVPSGKGGAAYKQFGALCLEAQHYPDSIHQVGQVGEGHDLPAHIQSVCVAYFILQTQTISLCLTLSLSLSLSLPPSLPLSLSEQCLGMLGKWLWAVQACGHMSMHLGRVVLSRKGERGR